MKRILIIIMSLILLSACSKNSNELINTIKLSFDNMLKETPSDININTYSMDTFKVDTEYLISIDTPDDVIDYVKEKALLPDIVCLDNNNLYYFVSLDVMRNTGIQKYKIYSASDSKQQCIFESSDNDKTKELFSAAVYDNCLYWSENIYSLSDSSEWRINKLDLTTSEHSIICDNTKSDSGIIPVLSVNSSGIYWYAAFNQDNKTKYEIEYYNGEKIKCLYDDTVCNNPYTRYTSASNSDIVLRENGFEGTDFLLPVEATELIAYYSVSDRYIVWITLSEKDNYLNKTINIYDIAQKNLFTADESDFGSVNGCGIIKNYVYMNISSDNDDYNGLYLFDPENSTVYDLGGTLENTEFSFPVKTQNGSIYFYSDKVYELN